MAAGIVFLYSRPFVKHGYDAFMNKVTGLIIKTNNKN
jgi:hypothetical protein